MFRKPTFNSLYDPFGSPRRGQKPSLPLKKEFFLPLRLSCKESSTSNQAFLLRRKDVTALLGARNRYAIRLSDHQRSSTYFAGWDRMGTEYYRITSVS